MGRYARREVTLLAPALSLSGGYVSLTNGYRRCFEVYSCSSAGNSDDEAQLGGRTTQSPHPPPRALYSETSWVEIVVVLSL